MNKKIIAFLMMTMGITTTQAEYKIYLPLPTENFNGGSSQPVVVKELKASPNIIDRGNSSTLKWNYPDLDEISIQGFPAYTSTNKKGSFNLSPNKTTTYTILIKQGAETITETITISVNQPAPTAEFTASALKIGNGDTVNLIWNTENVEFIEILGVLSKNEYTNTSVSITPTVTATYVLVAYGYEGQGNITKMVTIEVEEPAVINSFTVDKTMFSVGESATFNWNVFGTTTVTFNGGNESKIGSKTVPLSAAGSFTYQLKTTSFNGLVNSQDKSITVYAMPSLANLTVNDVCCGITVEPNTQLDLKWDDDGVSTYVLNGTPKTGGSITLTSAATSSNTNYIIVATNPAGGSVARGVVVTVMPTAPVITSITAPSMVFKSSPFTLSFTATGATNYTIKSTGGSSSGISGTINMNTSTSRAITPTSKGNYTYTITAKNAANVTTTATVNVEVVDLPTINSFSTSSTGVGLGEQFTLSWDVDDGEILTLNNSIGVVNGSSITITAPSSKTNITYTLTNSRTLNGITKNSTPKSVNVAFGIKPVITSFTGPSTGQQYVPFIVYWSGTNTIDYKLAGSGSGSAVTTGGEGVIVPQLQGLLTYTLTATSVDGIKATRTITVNVGPPPI